MQFSHSFLYGIIKLLYSLERYFHVVFKIPCTFTSSTTQSRVYIQKYTLAIFWGHQVSCTIYSYPFHLLLEITHSYVDQIICPAPFFKTKGKRNLFRPAEYVPVAFKYQEIKIETGVRGYLAVPVKKPYLDTPKIMFLVGFWGAQK